MKAIIHFLTREEGGREQPPSGPVYSTVADFLGHRGDDAWSVVIRFKAAPGLSDIEGEIQMLSPEAPNSLLHEGTRFRLLEGSRVVAIGQINKKD